MFKYLRILCLFLLLIQEACSPEFKLARKYIRNHKGNTILIIPVYDLGKDNLSISYDTNINYSPSEFDSIAWEQSCYVKHVSDSIFLSRFTTSLIKELTKTGFDVYVSDSSDDFNKLPDPKWLVNVAQLQLNEKHSISNFEVYDEKPEGYIYSDASLRLNMLSLHSWFEASQTDSVKLQVLYREEGIMDNRTLGFDFLLNKGKEGLQKNRDSLEMEDVYRLADESGRKHAESLFDHFLNEYISRSLPTGLTRKKYFYYDRISHSLKPGVDEWFEVENEGKK